MKNRAIVSERGTITIPGPIREMAHIHPGDFIEFKPQKDGIILRQLIVKRPDEGNLMSGREWDKFGRLVQRQLKKKQYTSYTDIDKAKLHSRKLMHKG